VCAAEREKGGWEGVCGRRRGGKREKEREKEREKSVCIWKME